MRPGIGIFGLALTLLVAVPAGAAPAVEKRPTEKREACDLLKRKEIAEVLDQEVGRPEDLGLGCFWELADADGGGLVLTLMRGREARADYRLFKAGYREADLTPLDLGRDAYATPLGDVAVLKNRKTAIAITGAFDAAMSEELARLAVTRL